MTLDHIIELSRLCGIVSVTFKKLEFDLRKMVYEHDTDTVTYLKQGTIKDFYFWFIRNHIIHEHDEEKGGVAWLESLWTDELEDKIKETV